MILKQNWSPGGQPYCGFSVGHRLFQSPGAIGWPLRSNPGIGWDRNMHLYLFNDRSQTNHTSSLCSDHCKNYSEDTHNEWCNPWCKHLIRAVSATTHHQITYLRIHHTPPNHIPSDPLVTDLVDFCLDLLSQLTRWSQDENIGASSFHPGTEKPYQVNIGFLHRLTDIKLMQSWYLW